MQSESKRDGIAAGAILMMFAGAFILSVSSLGLLPIAAGLVVMLLLILKALRKES